MGHKNQKYQLKPMLFTNIPNSGMPHEEIWSTILSWLPCLLLWSFLIEFLFEYDAISSPGSLPPPVVISYWIPIQIWCNILSWLPCLLLWLFLLNSYSNMMLHPLLAACLLQWSFLIEFLFKFEVISSPGCLASSSGRFLLNPYSNMMQYPLLAALPPPVVVSCWIPIRIWCYILPWQLAPSCGRFLLNSYLNMLQYPLMAALPTPCSFLLEFRFKYEAISSPGSLPPPVVVFYWIPIQIWSNILSWLPCLLLWSFLIEFLFEYDAISSPGSLPPPVVISYWIPIQIWCNILSWLPCLLLWLFLLNSYSNMMLHPLLAACLLQWSFLIEHKNKDVRANGSTVTDMHLR